MALKQNFLAIEIPMKKMTNGHIWPQISCQHHQQTTPEQGSEKIVRLGIFVWDRLKHQPDIYDNLILLIYRKIFRCLHFIFRFELFYQISAWLGYRFQIYVVFRKFAFSVSPPFLSSSIPTEPSLHKTLNFDSVRTTYLTIIVIFGKTERKQKLKPKA